MYLYGASGHAKVIIDIILALDDKVDGLFDDNEKVVELMHYPVFHNKPIKGPLIVSIGINQTRKKVVCKLPKIEYGIAIHPSSIISSFATIDEGTVVMQGAIIQSCVKIGKHCIINSGASVDHESIIEDYVHISPHSTICGNVQIGEGTWIGAGTTIIPNIHIGKWCIIGAGSVVTHDIPDNVLAIGNRCKIVKNIALE